MVDKTLKKVMVRNLEYIHDIFVEIADENKVWFEGFEKEFDTMTKSIEDV